MEAFGAGEPWHYTVLDMKIQFEGNRLIVDENEWETEYPILDAKEYSEKIVVIFDYMAFPKYGVARNLVAFDKQSKKIWVAENPSSASNDAYVNFMSSDKELKVYNFACYSCVINAENGKLASFEFTK